MDKIKHIKINKKKAEGIELDVYGYLNPGKPRVLLLHGASACHRTFLFGPHEQGLCGYLHDKDFEPWLLDWCGSHLIVKKYEKNWVPNRFDFDKAAAVDLPKALEAVGNYSSSDSGPARDVKNVVGFCMGGAVTAQSVITGELIEKGVSNITIMTIGLFYRTTPQGKLKVQDHVLERMLSGNERKISFIDSRCYDGTTELEHPWPKTFETMYSIWPGNFQPHHEHQVERNKDLRHVYEQCNRVSFMYGQPYVEENLMDEFHGSAKEIKKQFGGIPLRMYAHAASNARRGWAAAYGAPKDESTLLGQKAREQFAALDRITLITGAKNRLWQRDSIDRMYEWLRRPARAEHKQVVKHVLRGYGHQDLLWGKNSKEDVYKKIASRLTKDTPAPD